MMKFMGLKFFILAAFLVSLPAGILPSFQSEESTTDLASKDGSFFSQVLKNTPKPPARPVTKTPEPLVVTPTVVAPVKTTTPEVKPIPPLAVTPVPGVTPAAPEAAGVKSLYIADCNCELPNSEPRSVSYEDEKTCGPDRNYYSAALKKMPDFMREVRDNFIEAQVGRECVAYIMRTFLSSAQKAKSSSFVRCSTVKVPPVRGNKIHCVTEPYVNSVYNALVDVSDCLNINQADLLAKLANESGLHINAFGKFGDTGIGQLTGDAISTALQPYWLVGGRVKLIDYFTNEMALSNKPSCKRILSIPANYQKVSLDLSTRCSLMSPPENPYRNMLYTGLYYRASLHQIAGVKYVAGDDVVDNKDGVSAMPADKDFKPGGLLEDFEIRKNLIALGLKDPDMKAVERAVVMLGYNAGPGTAANYLNIYLKKRVQNKVMLKETDVNFLTTDFLSKWQKSISLLITKKKVSAELAAARKTAHTKSFPEFLVLMQNAGAPGYLSRVAVKHKELLEKMGDERCVTPNFIHF